MSLYIDYNHLAESNQIDKSIYNSIVSSKWSLIFLFLIAGPISSILPFTALFARTLIPDIYVRRIIGWAMIFWTCLNNMSIWMFFFLNIELIREFIRYGIPYFMLKFGTIIPTDPVSETMARRLFRVLKVITQQSALISLQQLIVLGVSYQQNDQSEAFSVDEKKKFKKFFLDFTKTSFIYEPESSSVTIFFPSFIARFNSQGLQLTNDDALKLIRSNLKSEDICPICREKYADLCIELKCTHRFCHKCIFSWLNQQYTCPMCRDIVN